MLKLEKYEVVGLDHAIRGMRNPKNSWDKSDSYWTYVEDPISHQTAKAEFFVGENDLKLAKTLAAAGTDHGKFLRMIDVYCDVSANHTWWAEFDTYKVGTVRDSCSKMHKIHVKEFVKDDFDHQGIDEAGVEDALLSVIATLEQLRQKFNETQDKRYWRAIIELLPMGFRIRSTIKLNYAVLRNMYHARRHHKLDEWHDFCDWIETLPYAKELIIGE